MELNSAVVEENEKTIIENTKSSIPIKHIRHSQICREFVYGHKKILSVGSSVREPIFIEATHAIDLSPMAGDMLKKAGWKGEFKVGSCTDLPYKDKEFDVAVCCEVIEHLRSLDDVIKTFQELDRVAVGWLVSTPDTSEIRLVNQHWSHNLFFDEARIKKLIPFKYRIIKHHYSFFVSNYPEIISKIISSLPKSRTISQIKRDMRKRRGK
ncbi:MAG: class I SAM-dependent methyltransferase [Candidatus Hodarchaeales archaeon]